MPDHHPTFFQGTEMPTAGWWEALWPDPAGVLTAVGLRSNMDVIDLCSGDGWFTLQIAKIARHVSAIDIDPTLLEVAKHRLVENGVVNCEFIAGDAYDIATLAGPATARRDTHPWRTSWSEDRVENVTRGNHQIRGGRRIEVHQTG
jgi:SAM-dependent methyltransferase